MCIITSKEHLIKEIAEALENSSSDVSWRIDLTAQEVIPILDPTLVDEDCMPENGHQMIDIDVPSSREGFEIMEDFKSQCPDDRQQDMLDFALEQRHPFSAFKNAVYRIGIQEEWFEYRNAAMKEKAKEWMKENKVNFIDGGIVCKSSWVYTYYNENEDEEEGNGSCP